MSDIETIIRSTHAINREGTLVKPHKFLMLLTVIDLFRKGKIQDGIVRFNEDIKNGFAYFFERYALPQDRKRPCAPFFHLKVADFWRLVAPAGKEVQLNATSSIGGPGELNAVVSHVVLSDFFITTLNTPLLANQLEKTLIRSLESRKNVESSHMKSISNNVFISYINSLHSLDSNSDGALAEMQATSPYFADIQVLHPWVEGLQRVLLKEGQHVILTGRAGDGKSTLAMNLYKRLLGLSEDQPLKHTLKKIERIPYAEGVEICLVKDLSECSPEDQNRFLEEMTGDSRHYLIVSNTGALLDLLRRNAEAKIQTEAAVLAAMSSPEPKRLNLPLSCGSIDFTVCNLGLRDNKALALQLWERMLLSPRWNTCEHCEHASLCPILRNVRLMQQYWERIRQRLSLLLTRITEYGGRPTMRQLSAHFAYMLTAGLSCEGIRKRLWLGKHYLRADYLFFNSFFGEAGDSSKAKVNAGQLHMVKLIREQGFDTLLAPAMERRLWLTEETALWKPGIPELEDYYQTLRSTATLLPGRDNSKSYNPLPAIHARRQIRRLFYFLHEPPNEQTQRRAFDDFMSAYLNSPMLLKFARWQQESKEFDSISRKLKQQLFRVLQEQFCGVRLPKPAGKKAERLYITLARRRGEVSQSAQVVLTQVTDFDREFKLFLKPLPCWAAAEPHTAPKYLPVLQHRKNERLELELPLPFLDYMQGREQGGVGATLERSYIDRLEKLKAEIAGMDEELERDRLTLLEQTINCELKTHDISIDQKAQNLRFE